MRKFVKKMEIKRSLALRIKSDKVEISGIHERESRHREIDTHRTY